MQASSTRNVPQRNGVALALLVLSSLVITVATIVLLGQFNQAQTNQRLKTDIETTHSELKTIAADLTKQTGMKWVDKSECYRLEPRLFGDSYKYTCDIEYQASQDETTNAKIQSVLKKTKIHGNEIDFGNGTEIVKDKDYNTIFSLSSASSEESCTIRYEYFSMKAVLVGTIRCTYPINESAFEYLSDNSILSIGQDR